MAERKNTIRSLPEYYEQIALRHDFALALAGSLKEAQVTSICEDLKSGGWRYQVEKGQDEEGESNYVVLIALDATDVVIAEAERQMTQRVVRTQADAAKRAAFVEAQDAKGISPKVSMAEY